MTLFKQMIFTASMCGALLSSSAANAQISDPGFENWDSAGNDFFKNYMPAGWMDMSNSMCASEGKEWAVTRSADAHSGNYAIKLKNIPLSSVSTPAMIMTSSGPAEQMNTKIPVRARHKKLEGYYKYASPGTDTFSITVLMMQGDSLLGFGDYRQTAQKSQYTKFSVPIMYVTSASMIPDSAVVMITAGSTETFVAGTTLMLDDVNFDQVTQAVQNAQTRLSAEVKLWPNPATNSVNLEVNGNLEGNVTIEVMSPMGQVLKTEVLQAGPAGVRRSIDLGAMPAGILFVKVSDQEGSRTLKLLHR